MIVIGNGMHGIRQRRESLHRRGHLLQTLFQHGHGHEPSRLSRTIGGALQNNVAGCRHVQNSDPIRRKVASQTLPELLVVVYIPQGTVHQNGQLLRQRVL